MKKIKLTKEFEGYYAIFKVGEIFESNEPYQGFNDDGSFTICQGMGIYHIVEPENFELIEEKGFMK